jgi:eukaryotic-like serine/threonine-protein kinase
MNPPDSASPLPSAPQGSLFAARIARVEALFNSALALPSEQREPFLVQAGEDDPSLESEVRELVAAHEKAGEFMADRAISPELEEEMAAFKSEAEGDLIGRYKLLQQIGVGGFGTVWMAEQLEPLVRKVALKIVQVGMNSKEVIGRFEQERQALAMMDHPNIAKVFDAGATKYRRPYFVMELVKGIPINQFCDEAGYGTRERVTLFGDVCAAIQHAHLKGIIHRDIKPSNVMVTLHGEKPVVKVIDFGIAKATHGKLTDKTLFTRFEQFIGTPVYMSPEQAALSGLDIDTRSDVYSLGILLYELLTGKPPFDAQTLASAGYDEMRRVIREVEPPKPSARLSTIAGEERTLVARSRRIEPEMIRKLIEPDLDWIVMKAIDKDRARRYATAKDLATDIECFLTDRPVSACPPSRLYELRKVYRRNKLVFTATAAIILVLSAGVLTSTWLAVRATRATRAAQIEADRGAQVAQFMKDMLQGVGPSVALGRDTTLLREVLDQTAQRLDTLEGQAEVEADLRKTLGDVYFELGRYSDASAMLQQAATLLEGASATESLELSDVLLSQAKVLGERKQLDEAEALLRRALALRLKTYEANSLPVADVINEMANIPRKQGKYDEAEALLRQCLATQRALLGEDNRVVADTLGNLGVVLRGARKHDEAESAFRQSLAIRRKLPGGNDLSLSSNLMNLGRALGLKGSAESFVEAEALLREALAIRKRLLGADHPEVAEALDFLAEEFSRARNYAEAEQLSREALAIRRRLPDSQNADIVAATLRVARAARAQEKPREVTALLTEAASLQRQAGGTPLEQAGNLEQLGNLYLEQKAMAEAEALYREALALREKALGSTHEQTLRLRFALIKVLSAKGNKIEAEQAYRDLFASQKTPLRELDAVFTTPLYEFAKLLDQNDKQAEAVAVLRDCVAQRQKSHGPGSTSATGPLFDLAGILLRLRKLDEAESAAREALLLARKETKQNTDALPRALYQLSGILAEPGQPAGKLTEAEVLARENLAVRETRTESGAALSIWKARRHLAGVLVAQKKIAEAEAVLSTTCQDFGPFAQDISSGDRRRLKESLNLFIKLCHEAGQSDKAAKWTATLAELKL